MLALMDARQVALFSTWDVVSETVTLLRYRASYQASIQFIEKVFPRLNLFSITDNVRREVLRVYHKFAIDKELSYCDMLSYVLLRHRKDMPCVSFDSDFKQLGLPVLASTKALEDYMRA